MRFNPISVAFGSLGLVGGAFYPFIAARLPRLRTYDLDLSTRRFTGSPGQPTQHKDLRSASSSPAQTGGQLNLLQLSDLHFWPGSTQLVRFLHQLADRIERGDMAVDLVLLTGDNLSDPAGLRTLQTALQPLLELVPGIFVYGSNDYYAGKFKLPWHYFWRTKITPTVIPDLPTKQLTQWLEEHGWINANNSCGTLDITCSIPFSPTFTPIDRVASHSPSGRCTGSDSSTYLGSCQAADAVHLPPKRAAATQLGTPLDSGSSSLPADSSATQIADQSALPDNTSGTNPSASVASSNRIRISYSGVNDPHIGRDELAGFDSGWQHADLRLGLTHAPYSRVLNQFAAARADLIVAGHTHGGQVCLPGKKALVNNTDIDLGFSGGLHQWTLQTQTEMAPRTRQGQVFPLPNLAQISQLLFGIPPQADRPVWLHVSRGLGTSKFAPVRVFCPPEASLLRLHFN